MLRNFQLVAIVKQRGETRLLRFPLQQDLQNTLAESWQEQYDTFVYEIKEIDFDAGYQPEEHERFRLQGYEPPGWLKGENSQTVSALDEIPNDLVQLDSVKGIVAFARNSDGDEVVLFQNFSRAHVIRPGWFLFLERDTYVSPKRPGLTLDSKLSAVYVPSSGKLLFQNFRLVNTFLSLAELYAEASAQQIREVLSHKLLAAEDADAVANGANQWFRKRFAMLRDSGVLDGYSAEQIEARSAGYDVAIELSKGKIVFPADTGAAKKLLQFLNEELFRGPITEKLFETNSKREAD